ncbi:hypothetical protein EDB84DRAFT_1447243 [Lactarius hengduanensis]|nr:hypothetical protein EDB84DRAFT_1447243 [Lactarius hengduanensis]
MALAHPTPRLDHFIAYALHRTCLRPSITSATLYLLQSQAFIPPRSSIDQCNDTYLNKSWCIISQDMFALREINQMYSFNLSVRINDHTVIPSSELNFTRHIRKTSSQYSFDLSVRSSAQAFAQTFESFLQDQ